MSSAVLLHLVTYGAIGTFGAVVAYKFFKIHTMPVHLRWELYPVGHEVGEKARYGGSYLEELDWWTKERESSLFNELNVMIPEMTLLVALYENNRKLWYRSFPFHFGLYTLAGLIGLIVFGAVMELLGFPVAGSLEQSSIIGVPVFYLTQIAAVVGLGLASLGALGLLGRRLFDPDLRDYTSAGHIFNLLLFIAVFGVAWVTFISVDSDFAMTRAYVQSLITFNLTADIGSPILAIEILLAVLIIAYIPITHMSHFFMKWFTYHKVRWDDEANQVGSKLEKKLIEQCQYPVTWAAPHLKADGKKNWVDICTEEVE